MLIRTAIAATALASVAVVSSATAVSASTAGYYGSPTSADRYYEAQTSGDCVEQSVRKAVDMIEGKPVVSQTAIDLYAKALGIDTKTGSLSPGKMADVVVWDHDPFSVYAHAEKVFIDGHAQSMQSRQTLLRDRYLEKIRTHTAR